MKVLYLYNPKAGNQAKEWLRVAQSYAMDNDIDLTATNIKTAGVPDSKYDRVIVAGGDGTINAFVNRIIDTEFSAPIAVLPAGTANDYAGFLGVSKNIATGVKTAFGGVARPVDIGVVNDAAFINVCGIGNFMGQPDEQTRKAKKIWGKIAYYVYGIKQYFKCRPARVRIETPKKKYRGKFYLLAVLIGSGAGSFDGLAPEAKNNDGLFDFVGLRKLPLWEFPFLLLKLLFRTHIKDRRVLHFQTNQIKIRTKSKNPNFLSCNIDGEQGPDLPATLTFSKKKLLFIHKK